MRNERLVKCPYCDHKNAVNDMEETSKITCSACKKPYKVNVKKTVSYETEPLESFMEHKGYLITQTKSNRYVLSKALDEYETKSEAMDALLDIIDAVPKKIKLEPRKQEALIDKFF